MKTINTNVSISFVISVIIVIFSVPTVHAQFDPFKFEIVESSRENHNLDGSFYRGDSVSYRFTSMPCNSPSVACRIDIKEDSLIVEVNGRRIDIIVPENAAYRTHNVIVQVSALRFINGNDFVVGHFQRSIPIQVVPYNPEMQAIAYTVMNDGERFSFEDRTGVVIKYEGSVGNNENDKNVYPQRRLMLNENYTSLVSGISYIEQDQGFNETIKEDVLDVKSENSTFTFMPEAGYSKKYYTTELKDRNDVLVSRYMNVTFHYYWNQTNYEYDVEYTFPNIRKSIANDFRVDIVPSAFMEVEMFPVEPEGDFVFYSLRDYTYDKYFYETNDRIMAEMVSEDVPWFPDRQRESGGDIKIRVKTWSLYIPEWILQEELIKIPYGEVVTDYKAESMRMVAHAPTNFYEKIYDLYNFYIDYEEIIDVREDVPAEVIQITSNSVTVKAPWNVEKVESNASLGGCFENHCSFELREPSHIKLFNEWNGTAVAFAEPFEEFELVTQKMLDTAFLYLVILSTLFIAVVFAKKLLN